MYVGLPRRPGAGAIRQAAAHPAPGPEFEAGLLAVFAALGLPHRAFM